MLSTELWNRLQFSLESIDSEGNKYQHQEMHEESVSTPPRNAEHRDTPSKVARI